MNHTKQLASFTIFEDMDGYWFVPSKDEADPATVAKPTEAVTYTTKIAACRAALEIAVKNGATELHLFGMGSTTSIKKEAKQNGITPFIYLASIRSRIAPYVPRRQMAENKIH
ncbi:hypothetical protein ACLS0R_07515 [Comamonas jiangduensis]|uniref:hypothetical protein n=1 Tax=Comamonas jiangduensis TaxID=1194168 RepID=UPI003BF819EB